MNRLNILFYLAITLALTSCFKDHSRGADIAISELTAKGTLDEIYRSGQGQTLTIPCPEIEIKGADKPLTYSWEVNYKEVSKEKDLAFPCHQFGLFPLRLKVTNGETTLFFKSQIDVQYRFRKGIYFLWGDASGAKVGYIDPLQPGEDIDLNTLALNNPKEKFEGEPLDLAFYARRAGKGFLLAAGKNLYSFSPDEMRFLKVLRLTKKIQGLIGDPYGEKGIFFYNGRFGKIDPVQLGHDNFDFRNKLISLPKKEFGKEEEPYLAPRLLNWRMVGGVSDDGYLVYDNRHEAIYAIHSKTEVWFKDETKGYELLEMLSLDQSQQMLFYLFSKSDGSIKALKFKPGLYKAGKRYNRDKELTYTGKVPESAKLGKESILVATSSSTRKLIYYTDPERRDIYGYNIDSNGYYDSKPLLKTPAGQKVVDMKVDKESKYLYVALTDGAKSTIQRIDLDRNEVDMEWTDLQVKIVKIALREDDPAKR